MLYCTIITPFILQMFIRQELKEVFIRQEFIATFFFAGGMPRARRKPGTFVVSLKKG